MVDLAVYYDTTRGNMVKVWCIIFSLLFSVAHAATEISSNFDNGNGVAESTFENPTNTLHIYTERDHSSESSWTDWFYFQLTDVNGKTLTVNIDFEHYASSSYWGDRNANIRPVWSYNNTTWTRISSGVTYSGGVLTFTMPEMAQSSVYVAWDYPYRYSDVVSDYATWSASDYALTAEILSTGGVASSQGGRNIYHLTIREDGYYTNRLRLIISARAHPGEVQASHMMKGMVDWLISSDSNAVSCRRKAIIDFFPMANPDGVYHGRLRAFDNGDDGNRGWQTSGPSSSTEPDETFLIHSKIHEKRNDTDFSVDLHGNYEYDVRIVDDNTNDNWSSGEESAIMTLLNTYDTGDYFRDVFVNMPSAYTTGYRRGQIEQYSYHALGVEGGIYYDNNGDYPTVAEREQAGEDLLRALINGMEEAAAKVGTVAWGSGSAAFGSGSTTIGGQ